MTDMLHTMIETAASTPAAKKEEYTVSGEYRRPCGTGEEMRVAVPKTAFHTPGLTITKMACASDASVVAIDTEKMENNRKRRARTRRPLAIWIRWWGVVQTEEESGEICHTINGAMIKMVSDMTVAKPKPVNKRTEKGNGVTY